MIDAGPRLVLGIAGPSGAGKSHLAARLADAFHSATVLSLDWFFRVPEDGIYANYWDVRCYDAGGFAEALAGLRAGRAIEAPAIDFRDFSRVGSQMVEPSTLIIAEGMALYRVPEIHSLIDVPIFLDPPVAVVRERKYGRDHHERARDPDMIGEQWPWVLSEWQADLALLSPHVHILGDSDPFAAAQALISSRLRW